MLRITIRSEPEAVRLVVEGKLAGHCVTELEKSWLVASTAEPRRAVLVDLSAVTFIDDSGRNVLRFIKKTGGRFLATGVMTRSFIEEIEATRDSRSEESEDQVNGSDYPLQDDAGDC